MEEALSEAAVDALATRLAALPLLHGLPHTALADCASARHNYVANLLRRNAALFLERHGALLHASELQAFPSSTSQLVQPLLARLEAPQSSALAKNRRLAHLEVLEAEGFFSEEAMRTRAPLLYHHYVGKWNSDSAEAPDPGAGAHAVSERLLQRLSDSATDERLRAELQREAAVEEESSSSSDEGEEEPEAEATPEAKALRVESFRRAMRELVLYGAEKSVDYSRVDNNAALDDASVVARVRERDLEDAWFAEDDAPDEF